MLDESAILSWRPCTRAQYGSRLGALASYATRTSLPTIAEALAGVLAERALMGATASSIGGFTSAVRAVEDLQCIAPAVTTLHERITTASASDGLQTYLLPTGLVILVENASKSRYGPSSGPSQPLPRYAFCALGRWPLSEWRISRFRGLSSSGIAKMGKRGTPPDPCQGTRTKYASGPTPSCWDLARNRTCWSGKQVKQAWSQRSNFPFTQNSSSVDPDPTSFFILLKLTCVP